MAEANRTEMSIPPLLKAVMACVVVVAVLAICRPFSESGAARRELNKVVRNRTTLAAYRAEATSASLEKAEEARKIARQFEMDVPAVEALCRKYDTILFVPYDSSVTCLLFFDRDQRAAAYVLGSQ